MKRIAFILLGLLLPAALFCVGCGQKSTDEAGGDAQAQAPAGPDNAQAPEFVEPEIVSLAPEELSALGTKNELPTEWVIPGAFSAKIIRPLRFKGYEGAAEAARFFGNNPQLVPNWIQFQNMDVVLQSDSFAFAPLTDPATGNTLGQRFPLPVKAVYLQKSEPFNSDDLASFAFGAIPKEKIVEQTFGVYAVKTVSQPVQIPLDNTGKQTATINDMIFALFQPSENSAVIINGPKETVEKFFTAGSGDERGALAQRLGRFDTASADFAFLYDFQNSLKEAIQLPVGEKLGTALFENAKSVAILIDANAAENANALSAVIETASPEAAAAVETATGSALMELAGQFKVPENLPDNVNIPDEMTKFMGQFGELIKNVSMQKTDSNVTLAVKKTPELATLAAETMQYVNNAYDSAMKGARYQQTANQLAMIGQLMSSTYYAKNNAFPPTAISSPDGKPLLSWRVALLPALGPDGEALFAQFKLDEPWDSENNIKLLEKMPILYRCPLDGSLTTKTTFQMYTGADMPFGKTPQPLKMSDIPNPGKTFLVVSVVPEKAIEWTRPDELAFEPEKFGETFGELVLAVPVMGELFDAPFTNKPEEVQAVSDWIRGTPSEPTAEPEPAPAPVEAPAEMPAN